MDTSAFRIALIAVIMLAGCGSNPKAVFKSSSSIQLPTQVVLDFSRFNECNVALNSIGYDGEKQAELINHGIEAVGETIHTASRQPYFSAGAVAAGAGVGIAAALITERTIRLMKVRAAQKKKNEPVKEWLSRIESIDWQHHITEVIDRKADIPVLPASQSNFQVDGNIMNIFPWLEVTSNYQSLELHLLVEILSPNKKRIYTNYYHLQSLPLFKQDMIFNDLNAMDEEQTRAIVLSLFDRVMPLIYADINANDKDIPIRSIKFRNHVGSYYERGKLLIEDAQDGYITFKTLRGEIKHYPLETMSDLELKGSSID